MPPARASPPWSSGPSGNRTVSRRTPPANWACPFRERRGPRPGHTARTLGRPGGQVRPLNVGAFVLRPARPNRPVDRFTPSPVHPLTRSPDLPQPNRRREMLPRVELGEGGFQGRRVLVVEIAAAVDDLQRVVVREQRLEQ